MKIFIMRHGEASHTANSDAERHLTIRGRLESLAVVKDRFQPNVNIDKVLVSPYVRAQETWDEVSSYIHCDDVESCADITPFGQPERVYDYVTALIEAKGYQTVLIVSHLPLVGYMTSEFVPDMAPPMFPTSGVVCIEFDVDRGQGEVIWKHHPEVA